MTTNKFKNQSSFNNPKVEIKNSINQIPKGRTRFKNYIFNSKLQYKLSNTGVGYKYLAGYLLYQLGFEVTKVYKD